MRWLPAIHRVLLLVAIGVPGEAVAACCITAPPVHVYVPPPTHVIIVPHTTFVRPMTATRLNPRASTKTVTTNVSTPQTVHTKPPHPHIVPTVVVDNQPTPTSTRCKQQAGKGCKKKEDEPTGWATLRRWLQIGKQ